MAATARNYKHETFPNAPIVEAIVNFIVAPELVNEMKLDEFYSAVSDIYPLKEETSRHLIQLRVPNSEPEVTRNSAKDGFILRSATGIDVIQVRNNGLQLSRLYPYKNFPVLRDEALRLFSIYSGIFNPPSVLALGMRYINKILLPLPLVDFKDYVLTGVEIAEGLSQSVTEMFFRVGVTPSNHDPRMSGFVTSTFEPPQDNKLPYIFDIDIILRADVEPKSAQILEDLKAMREFKNEIFFCSMTEKAKEMFR